MSTAASNTSLRDEFTAMVAELRPKWRAQSERRNAVTATWLAQRSAGRPAPRAFTVDDYRAAVLAFDAGDLMSDIRSEWLDATYKAAELDRLARIFDPDRSIRNEIESNRRFV